MEYANNDPWEGFDHPSPREWQAQARDKILKCIDRKKRGIVSAVMGAGKSAVIAEVIYSLSLYEDEFILVTTPKVDLVDQLYEDISSRVPPRYVGRYYTHEQNIEPITICCMRSAPKIAREILSFDNAEIGLWIADEAHRTECETMHDAYESIQPNSQIGFTATPYRADENEALELWDELIFEYSASDAIKDGVVVPPKVRDYSGPRKDVDEASIEMIEETLQNGPEYNPGMVNALTIDKSSQMNSVGAEPFADRLQNKGIKADTVHSEKSQEQNEEVMKRLAEGQLDCVVHVNILSEGADYPWLRWLCMRRPVGSRTRFSQEVGRILRADDNKDFGLVLDPHNLFDEFGLNYKAVLSGGSTSRSEPDNANEASTQVEETIEEIKEALQLDLPTDWTPNGTPVQALDPAVSWIKQTKLALESYGYIDSKIESTGWRDDRMTPKQKSTIQNMKNVVSELPDSHCQSMKVAARIAEKGDLTKGQASDLISIQFAISNYGWPGRIDKLVE